MNEATTIDLMRIWERVEQSIPSSPRYGDKLSQYNKGGRDFGRFVLRLIDEEINNLQDNGRSVAQV